MTPELTTLATAGCRFVRLARGEKRPIGAAWQTKATNDIEVVAGWLKRDRSNVGLLLGPASGVIDVEYDTPGGREQLAALGLLDIQTPTWRSARGEHRLFRWPTGCRRPPLSTSTSLKSASAAGRRRACCRRRGTRAAATTSGSCGRATHRWPRSRPACWRQCNASPDDRPRDPFPALRPSRPGAGHVERGRQGRCRCGGFSDPSRIHFFPLTIYRRRIGYLPSALG